MKNSNTPRKSLEVEKPSLESNPDYLINDFSYITSEVVIENEKIRVEPKKVEYTFKTSKKLGKVGLLLVGLGGSNGTTVYGGILANKHNLRWRNKNGEQKPNFYGSITQCSTTKIGLLKGTNKEFYLPLRDIIPMVDPCDLVINGWDISSKNLAEGMEDAKVFEYDLQQKLYPYMKDIVPMKGLYYEDFIASNQKARADYAYSDENAKWNHLEIMRKDISEFKKNNKLDKVIVLWTANTERLSQEEIGVHDTSDNILNAIRSNHKEISPSMIYAVASILEGCSFINGSPQNTIVQGIIDLADKNGVFVAGDDFKSGQTKFKTAFTEFLVQAGIKPKSIVSYNHLGNNDGKNLSSESQFKSKEKSKSSCVDDILYANTALFKENEKIDHCVVIKYVPHSGDSKKAIDEYSSEIFMGGQHVVSVYNVCEDSLLAAPLIIDLVLLTELFERIEIKKSRNEDYSKLDTVIDFLGYLLKAPLTRQGLNVVNSLNRQKNCLENFIKVCAGIPLENNLLLERRIKI